MSKNKLIAQIKIVIVLILLLTSTGCMPANYYNLSNDSSQVFNNTIDNTSRESILPMEGDNIIGIRLFDKSGVIVRDHNFILNKGEKWENFISIVHINKESEAMKLLLFVDYKKTSFLVDSKKVADYTFKIGTQNVLDIPISIEPLSNGFHDVLFIFIRHAETILFDDDHITNVQMDDPLFLRYTISVADNNVKDYRIEQLTQSNISEPYLPICSNRKEQSELWLTDTVAAGEIIQYTSKVKNTNEKDTQSYALISLFDWNSTQLNKDGDEVLFFRVNAKKEISINSSIKVPTIAGTYRFVPILISNPYKTIERKSTSVYVGNKTILKVE